MHFIFSLFFSPIERGALADGFAQWIRKFLHVVRCLRSLGSTHYCCLADYGGSQCFLARLAFALGRIPEQVLWRQRHQVPAILFQVSSHLVCPLKQSLGHVI
jgi:hypothetical protein